MRREAVAERLREKRFVSGEQLAGELGVTRAAIAKAVAALRAEGYRIEAVRNRGYRLEATPDILSEQAIRELLPNHPWKDRIHVLGEVDSTNRVLKKLAEDGAPEGTVVLADSQTAGRGRLGRSFYSAPQVGVYLSVLLRPKQQAQELITLTAQTAVAVSESIETVCGTAPGIKWVNDLLLGGRKICGILTELSIEAESASVKYAIIGIGVNCNQRTDDFPDSLQQLAGSVFSQTGIRIRRNELVALLLQRLSALPYTDWHSLYRTRCVTIGQEVTFFSGGAVCCGRALDVGSNAELLIALPDGTVRAVNSGEVSIRPTGN